MTQRRYQPGRQITSLGELEEALVAGENFMCGSRYTHGAWLASQPLRLVVLQMVKYKLCIAERIPDPKLWPPE